MSATQTTAAAVCLDMGMAQLDESIQQTWAGMSARERGNCSGAYSAWNTLKLAYDATAVVSVVRGGVASIKYMTGLLRLNRSFSRFVTGGKAIYNAVKSRTLSAPMGRMGARMERYVEWGRLSGAGKLSRQQIEDWVGFATKQDEPGINKVMFGMWDGGGVNSYIHKAGKNHVYFDFGDKWDELYNFVNRSNDEIWKINKEFIDRQKLSGREFWFSHDPFSPKNEQFFAREVNYIIDLGAKDFQKVGNLWKAIW